MAYSPTMRLAIGHVRKVFEKYDFGIRQTENKLHGYHEAHATAPLILIACSGGRDSLALAIVAHKVAGMLGIRCGVVIVDHQLSKASTKVTNNTAHIVESMGLNPVIVKKITVNSGGDGVEAQARKARYDALIDAAHQYGASAVCVAHTRDDQAETVLLRIIRSSSASALTGMPHDFKRENVLFIRPFLELTRADTTQICRDNNIEWWDDPTNGDGTINTDNNSDYPLRSQVRHILIPLFNQLSHTDISSHIAPIADSLRGELQYLDREATSYLDEAQINKNENCNNDEKNTARLDKKTQGSTAYFDARKLANIPEVLLPRAIKIAIERCGVTPRRVQIEQVCSMITQWHGQAPVKISSRLTVNRRHHVIILCHDSEHANS